MNDQPVSERTPLAVHIVSWLTAVWFILLFFLVEGSAVCPGTEASRWWALQTRYLACRPANEVGDFLAGAFAPVAFAWLVATVFIQSAELKEQRRELKAARAVAEDQSRAAALQAEEIGAQTRLLVSAEAERSRAAHDRLVEAELDSFLREVLLGELRSVSVLLDGREDHWNINRSIVDYSDVFGAVAMIRNRLDATCGAVVAGAQHGFWKEAFDEWSGRLERLMQSRDLMSPGMRLRIDDLHLDQIVRIFRSFQLH